MRFKRWHKIVALAVVMVSSGVGRAQFFGGGDVAARVNGEVISLADVKTVLDQRPAPVALGKDQERAARKAALEMLIDDALMRQYLRRNVQAPNSAEIEKVVNELRDVLKKQNKALEQFLRDEKQTEQQLRADIASDLQWKAFLASRFTEQEARSYFDTYRPFFEKVQVKASHILIKLAPTASPAERDNLKARLDNLRGLIKSNQLTFEEAARKYSGCPSKERGGDLGYFTYKFTVVEPFARAAYATPVGDITNVVATEFGLHLIKVVDRTAAEPADFEAMKDVVRKTMAQDQLLFRDILGQQRRAAKIEYVMQ